MQNFCTPSHVQPVVRLLIAAYDSPIMGAPFIAKSRETGNVERVKTHPLARSLGVLTVTLYNNAIGLIGLIDGGYMDDEQRIQLAVLEFERIGRLKPRRWMAKFGGIKLSDFDAPHRLKSSYSACRRQVEALIPTKQDGDQLETYTAHTLGARPWLPL